MLNEKELATVLAALRYWQEDIKMELREVSDHFIDVKPLTNDEIDDLCEKLNTEDPMLDLLEAAEKVKSLNSKYWLNHSMVVSQDCHEVAALINEVTTILESAIRKAKGE